MVKFLIHEKYLSKDTNISLIGMYFFSINILR